MKANITIMPGDGVGPEITREAVKVLQAIESVFDHDFLINESLFFSNYFLWYQFRFIDKCCWNWQI